MLGRGPDMRTVWGGVVEGEFAKGRGQIVDVPEQDLRRAQLSVKIPSQCCDTAARTSRKQLFSHHRFPCFTRRERLQSLSARRLEGSDGSSAVHAAAFWWERRHTARHPANPQSHPQEDSVIKLHFDLCLASAAAVWGSVLCYKPPHR